ILNDISKLAHLSAGKEIRFQKVSLETAEKLYDENKKYLDKIFQLIKTILLWHYILQHRNSNPEKIK
ncbi:MAG: hypothetical protein QF864_13170, partial [SAR202 cluster bacterium]|nr:hypothetical protein [SAR202 cluster bacterium]